MTFPVPIAHHFTGRWKILQPDVIAVKLVEFVADSEIKGRSRENSEFLAQSWTLAASARQPCDHLIQYIPNFDLAIA